MKKIELLKETITVLNSENLEKLKGGKDIDTLKPVNTFCTLVNKNEKNWKPVDTTFPLEK